MKAQIPIIKGDKVGIETDYRDALMVNMYAVSRKILGAAGYILSYPGLRLLSLGTGVDRGANYHENIDFEKQFRVSGQKLISVDTDGAVVEIGDIPGTEQVSMPYSFRTQCIIASGQMFLYDNVTFSEVIDPELGSPIDCVWVDQYYFLTDGDKIYHTDIDDESAIDPTNIVTAEFSPDKTLGVALTQDNKVMVLGRYTTEYFVNDASVDFSFQRIPTRAQKIGIVATHAKCESGGKFYITGGRKEDAVSVHIVSVGSSQKISTREIDKILSQYTEPELFDMRMEARTEDNVTFILVHLPNETLCFNESIASEFGLDSSWTILKSDVYGDIPYRAINGVFDPRTAKWIYGDKINSNIGELDNEISSQYGEIVEGIFYTPFVKLERYSIDSIELETIPGFTISEDATVAFSVTTNGITYGSEYWDMYGFPLDYGKRFIQRRIGYVDDKIGFKYRIASSSRMAFCKMEIEYG